MKIFHQRLKETMREKKVTQRKLAEMLGVSQQAVCGWSNKDVPTLERFKQICEVLNVDSNFLLGLSINTGGGVNNCPLTRACVHVYGRALCQSSPLQQGGKGDDFRLAYLCGQRFIVSDGYVFVTSSIARRTRSSSNVEGPSPKGEGEKLINCD